jgi:peptidoglycan hydrolase-like protein with peptidoglycan-binding domain
MRLALVGVGSQAPFALTREPIEVRGTVKPYVAGQSVRVKLYSDGRRVAARTFSVVAHGADSGVFQGRFPNAPPGRVRVLAVHVATPQMQQFAAGSEDITVLSPPALTVGARGATVWLLQRALGALHYAVPQSGYFDEATAEAVIAYRKITGLPPVPDADESVFRMLARGAGAFHVRYPQDGRHVEADLTEQVLAEIEPHGRVYNIYPTSSGKPSTPTVTGHFHVYLKTPGLNSESMLDSNYFITGYAIHGYPEVPTYPASHGCLRVPDLDAPSIYGWVRLGTPVDVYY